MHLATLVFLFSDQKEHDLHIERRVSHCFALTTGLPLLVHANNDCAKFEGISLKPKFFAVVT
jgi:hypothetical protein